MLRERPIRRIRRTERPGRAGRQGYSLVEVIISILLASVITTSVFSVVLTSKMDVGQNGRNEREKIAGQASREITTALRNFVTGCCDPAAGTCKTGAVAYGCGEGIVISGPNNNNGAIGGWSFNNYVLSSGAATDSQGSVYAFTTGTHTLGNVLPTWFTSAPYNAAISYTVDDTLATGWTGGAAYPTNAVMPKVAVNVTWTEP